MRQAVAQNGYPPERVNVATGATSGEGPLSYWAALAPYFKTLGDERGLGLARTHLAALDAPVATHRSLRLQILTVNRFITTVCWACSAPDLSKADTVSTKPADSCRAGEAHVETAPVPHETPRRRARDCAEPRGGLRRQCAAHRVRASREQRSHCGRRDAGASAAANSPLAVLIDQGRYWQAHRRGDLAEQAWQKVLRIDPKQPDALYGMGMVLADRKDGSGAQQYLQRLREAAPNYPNIDELGRRLGETSPRDQTVNDARRLAQSGQSASAVQEYQRALDGKPATPELTLEYYQALAATPQGWDQARRGLTQLARENPNDPRYALALAQHLTYRDTTRRDGIARLAQLSTDSTVGEQAKKSWRQALLWLGARASDAPLYQAYLQASPDDAAVKARFDSMVQQDKQARDRAQANAAVDARGRAVADGFAALDRGDIVTARARFSAVLANSPNDGDALGGMGIAALKQEKFDEARTYLERASRTGNPARWKDALTSATYWSYTSAGIGARSNGEIAKAKSMFERAIALESIGHHRADHARRNAAQ